jgi:V8-like Glu-specific endopeptidase
MRIDSFLKDVWSVFLVLFVAGCPAVPGDSLTTSPFGRTDGCESGSNWFAEAEGAIYSVIVRVHLAQPQGAIGEGLVGTAFAIDRRTLATNAHIVEGIYDRFTNYDVAEVVARQSGTDREVRIIGWAVHTRVLFDPVQDDPHSPDVAILKVDDDMEDTLDLAGAHVVSGMRIGDQLMLAGFPGDVYQLNPFALQARASLLGGQVSNLSDYEGNGVQSAGDADVFQHSIPTSGGTSGSPIAYCGKVVAINYAGTADLDSDNNFGVNVDALRELIADVASYSVSVTPLIDVIVTPPVPACPPNCDYCNVGTEYENNCPVEWNNDGECDCGCQFNDIDCPDTGSSIGSGCLAVCDYCNFGSEYENNCPTSWNNDGECDCGCQFNDADCP